MDVAKAVQQVSRTASQDEEGIRRKGNQHPIPTARAVRLEHGIGGENAPSSAGNLPAASAGRVLEDTTQPHLRRRGKAGPYQGHAYRTACGILQEGSIRNGQARNRLRLARAVEVCVLLPVEFIGFRFVC